MHIIFCLLDHVYGPLKDTWIDAETKVSYFYCLSEQER